MSSETGVVKAHRGLAFLFLALALIAFLLAGYSAFGGDGGDFEGHSIVTRLLTVLSLVILILAAVGRRAAIVQSAALFGLMILQTLLAGLGTEVSAVFGALHPVNGLLIMFVAHQAARGLPLPFVGGSRAHPVS